MNNYSKSIDLYEKGKKYLFEATSYAIPILEKGKGSYVWDVDGNKYLDLNAGQFCVSFGHAYIPFSELVKRKLDTLYHTNTSTLSPDILEAAEKMASTTGGQLSKTLFLSTGSEANECAIRYARFITGRDGIMCLDQGYHGLTLGSQHVTMGGRWALPGFEKTVPVLTPDPFHATGEHILEEALDDLDTKFRMSGEECAAFILEPVVGVGGMFQIPPEYLKAVRRYCSQYGVLLICDECQSGFGRSGKWYAYEYAEIVPDIVVTAKAMGMGLAVSAVTFRESIAEQAEGKLTHFSSHQNDPLSAAVVGFVIDQINALHLLESNDRMGKCLLDALKAVCSQTEFLINPRGIGLMCGFDLNDAIITQYREFSRKFVYEMQNNGVLIQAIRQGRTFRVMPNYFITQEEIDVLSKAIEKTINVGGIK